eukprot:TRINITY_DN17833_c0_g1_i1.p2 TRINITY_DN17833_c0_g1~~TRINITY_DN17833_c0_g1_i1.p2  ORF type:complete len:131 (-),score=34.68 TRINITY_DN17833_c0_g1_i1:234-626(-)
MATSDRLAKGVESIRTGVDSSSQGGVGIVEQNERIDMEKKRLGDWTSKKSEMTPEQIEAQEKEEQRRTRREEAMKNKTTARILEWEQGEQAKVAAAIADGVDEEGVAILRARAAKAAAKVERVLSGNDGY